jgi:hypothetical protein
LACCFPLVGIKNYAIKGVYSDTTLTSYNIRATMRINRFVKKFSVLEIIFS